MKRTLFVAVICWLFFSCQEEVKLELKEFGSVPVIEANWTNKEEFNNVKISFSNDYYDSTTYEVYKDAEVYLIESSSGEKIDFLYDDKRHVYLPVGITKGEIGKEYALHVNMENQSYRSTGILLAPPVLDSISYTYKEERALRPAGYYLKVYGKIPFEENNYYRIMAFTNQSKLTHPKNFLMFDDTFGTNLLNNGFELENIPFQAGETAYLALFRLNKDAYNYMSGLFNILVNDGGLFSPPPQNPKSNIDLVKGDKTALGYFLVSPLLTEKVEIKAKAD